MASDITSKGRRSAAALLPPSNGWRRLVVGTSIFAVGWWALARDVTKWNAIWYLPAWYGYLLVLDGLIHRLQGHSFLLHRRRELGAMMFWSVPFWFVFEAYNLVIKNWYYVFILQSAWTQAVLTWLAFATVLPACFVHAELVGALGWWRDVRWRPIRVERTAVFLAVLGALCLVLPLVWPRYTFWMVWGAALGVPEFVNLRIGAPSLLRDLERGRPGRLLRLLAGGLLAGLVWEGLNFWSRTKWVYTVPGFEDWKLFEMPLLGFLGFPFLALEGFAVYSLLCHLLRGGRTWEQPDDQPSRPRARGPLFAAGAGATLFSAVTFAGVMDVTARSRRPSLGDLDALNVTVVVRIQSTGLQTPEQLYNAIEQGGVAAVAERTRVDAGRLERAYRHAALALHKGMGAPTARLLLDAGVSGVADLAAADASALWHRLNALAAQSGKEPPRLAEVKVWIRAARPDGKPRR